MCSSWIRHPRAHHRFGFEPHNLLFIISLLHWMIDFSKWHKPPHNWSFATSGNFPHPLAPVNLTLVQKQVKQVHPRFLSNRLFSSAPQKENRAAGKAPGDYRRTFRGLENPASCQRFPHGATDMFFWRFSRNFGVLFPPFLHGWLLEGPYCVSLPLVSLCSFLSSCILVASLMQMSICPHNSRHWLT